MYTKNVYKAVQYWTAILAQAHRLKKLAVDLSARGLGPGSLLSEIISAEDKIDG